MVKKKGNNIMLEVQTINVPFHWIDSGEKRLDARFYTQDVIAARILVDKIQKKGIRLDNITGLSKRIFWPGRFKRCYVSQKEGKPFLMPSEVFMFLPKATKYITNYPSEVLVKENWLLITRSGTIGRCLISTKYLENFVLSDDLIRIIPNDNRIVGYLYAYLNTWIGQAFLTKDRYGATVKHIEPHHVTNIPTPRIPDLEEEINQKILEAHKLREEAQELLLKAEETIYSALGLPKIDEDDVEYFGGEIGRFVKAFEVKASELDYRLDASYHVPILRLIKKNLKEQENKGKFRLKRLGDGIAKVFDLPTYKRIYVKPEEGYPILSGTHLRQIKLYDLKYISGRSFYQREKSVIDKYKVKKRWILTTERGTTGVSALVTEYWDGWLASHNILRVVPQNINSGYLLAYLNTEYAQYQLKSKELGAVVEVLDPRDMEDIMIPIPRGESVQNKIDSLVNEAYNKKDKANQIEEEAIKELEKGLEFIAEERG
ncbi:MAG TPA: hypothetical protein ENI52_06460 [Thermoplasmata archaeon]|nr:hypothetical protein [Thermoplasmata archaeon]